MTAQELVTASSERIPIKVAILNNAYLGMVRQWQEMFYEERYSEVYLSPDLPDYVKWAEAMGCVGFRVESPEEVAPDDREGQRHRRPARWSSTSAPTPGRRCSRWCRPARPTTTWWSTPPSSRAARGWCSERAESSDQAGERSHPPDPLGAGREPVRRAGPGQRAVRPPGLQHHLAGRGPLRRRALQPHHHRHRRRGDVGRADHQAAVQAGQRGQDHRAAPRRRRRARAAAGHRGGRRRASAARSSSWSACSRARSSTWRRPS